MATVGYEKKKIFRIHCRNRDTVQTRNTIVVNYYISTIRLDYMAVIHVEWNGKGAWKLEKWLTVKKKILLLQTIDTW